jgi:hypothetical protein
LFPTAFRGACPRDRRLEAIIRKSCDYLLKFSDLFSLKRIDPILAKAIAHKACATLLVRTPVVRTSVGQTSVGRTREKRPGDQHQGKDHDDVR